MRLILSKQAMKALRQMQPQQARTIRERLQRLAADPTSERLDIRPLTGRDGYRLRVGNWRVIYALREGTIDVAIIAPRGDAYKR